MELRDIGLDAQPCLKTIDGPVQLALRRQSRSQPVVSSHVAGVDLQGFLILLDSFVQFALFA